ncbi:lipopolysaccharide transport periplasmic protein LptA [Desulfosoma caldarium]|uniref:Lipopolysaccharide export system protein LptA n=1 Tax=Desulfosoma caldarium TaxID=610254 RepID=A0A3N1UV55_9BACT|nr:lipopolysaccharide transport periplasmic protein LptA [Desulfosoma caldarium]ROQ91016.1 lipopolysaccharide export system protein LptA [Desulfosoma caldarium]
MSGHVGVAGRPWKMKAQRIGWRCAVAAGFAALVLAFAPGLCAQNQVPMPERAGREPSAPIQIASDRMVADQKSRTVVFEGHVVVKQGTMTITAEKLTVYGVEKAKGSGVASGQVTGDQIDRIEAEGNVVISEGDRVATSKKALLDNRQQKVVLMGDPILVQGKDKVQGDLITLYLQEQRSVVEGRAGRPVQAVFHPKESSQKP